MSETDFHELPTRIAALAIQAATKQAAQPVANSQKMGTKLRRMNDFSAKVSKSDPNFGDNKSSIELVDDGNDNVSLRGTDANGTSSSIPVEMANNGAIKIKASQAQWPFVIE